MNITKTNLEGLNAVLKVQVEKSDYENKVEDALKDYRKKASLHGFRPGKVPAGLIKKMYGKALMADEINKLVNDSLNKYIEDEKLEIIGHPIPSEKEQKEIDFETESEFEFVFEIGLSPEIKLSIDNSIELPYYSIAIDDKMLEEQINWFGRRYGENIDIEISDTKSFITGSLVQTDNAGNIIDGGIAKSDVKISVSVIKNEEIKNKFIGANINQVIDFDIKKAFENETEISTMLAIPKEDVENLLPDFQYTIKSISAFKEAEINQDLFDKIYGPEVVTSVDQMKVKIVEDLKKQFAPQSDYKLLLDVQEKFNELTAINLPNDFLKKWLLFTDQENKLTPELIENEYPLFEKDTKWQLIKNFIIKENEIKVTEDDIKDAIRVEITAQLKQYGFPLENLPPDFIDNMVKERLQKQEDVRKAATRNMEDKVLELIKQKIKLNEKEVTMEEFNHFFEK